MKRLPNPLALSIILTLLLSVTSLALTPTPTIEPIPATLPEGWTAVAETRDIGGRQVALNEKGDAATQIDGEWYPVDAKGCYYEELLSPEVQNNPKLVEAHKKIISESSYTIEGKVAQYPRYLGSTPVGIIGGQYPAIYDLELDALPVAQKLCYQNGKWYHVTDQAMAVFKEIAPNDSIFMRGVVGWFEGDQYKTFTYLEKTNERVKGGLDLTNAETEKANDFNSAYKQWKNIIESNKQVGIRLPCGILESESGTSDNAYDNLVSQLVNAAHDTVAKYWTSSIEDDVFEEWAKSDGNQEKYFSDIDRLDDLFVKNRKAIWSTWMTRAAKGTMPIPHIRTITTGK